MRYEGGEGQERHRSKLVMYSHLVWATKRRAGYLTPEFERRIHRCIVHNAEKLGCQVLAVGGMPDHVHLVVRTPGTLCPSVLVKQVKGAAGVLYNQLRPEFSEPFHWQDGYASYSLWYTKLDSAISYVHNQKERHASGNLYEPFEQFDEIVPHDLSVPRYVFPDEEDADTNAG